MVLSRKRAVVVGVVAMAVVATAFGVGWRDDAPAADRAVNRCMASVEPLPEAQIDVFDAVDPVDPELGEIVDPGAAAIVAAAGRPSADSLLGPASWVSVEEGGRPAYNDIGLIGPDALLVQPDGLLDYDPEMVAVDPLSGDEVSGVHVVADDWSGTAVLSGMAIGAASGFNEDAPKESSWRRSIVGIDVRARERTWCFTFDSYDLHSVAWRADPDDPDRLIVASSGGHVAALDPSSGEVEWDDETAVETPENIGTTVRLAVDDGYVATQAGASQPVLVRDVATGMIAAEVAGDWTRSYGADDLPTSQLDVISEGRVFMTEGRPDPTVLDAPAETRACIAELVAYDFDGDVRWRSPRGSFVVTNLASECSADLRQSPRVSPTLVHDDAVVYYDVDAAALRALSAGDGSELWAVPASPEGVEAAVSHGDWLFLPDQRRGLVAIDLGSGAVVTALSWDDPYAGSGSYFPPGLTIAAAGDDAVLIVRDVSREVTVALPIEPR